MSPRNLTKFAAVVLLSAGQLANSQSELISEQGNIPALFAEVEVADPRATQEFEGLLRVPGIERARLLRVNRELLRSIEYGDEPYPLFLNLFPDLGFRIYVFSSVDRYYGYDWLASPTPVYDGRRFIEFNLSVGDHPHSGLNASMNSRALGLEGIIVRRMSGTDFVAVVDYDTTAWPSHPTAPEIGIRQSANVVLTDPGHSFVAEAGIRIDYSALDAFFPSVNTGYFLTVGGEQHGGASKLYKTIDGGKVWTLLNADMPGTPTTIHFVSDEEGYVALRRNIRCVRGIDCTGRLLKTQDGGNTWDFVEEPVFAWVPAILDVKIDGSLFGISRRFNEDSQRWNTVLVRSKDGAASWTEVFKVPEVQSIVAATSEGNVIYIGFENSEIYEIDVNGGAVSKIVIDGYRLTDFEVPSPDVIVASVGGYTGRELLRSVDRGVTWEPVLEGFHKLVAAPSDEEILVILNKGRSAPTDTASSADVLAYTLDGGETWEETVLVGGLIMHTKRRQQVSDSVFKLLLSDRVLDVRVPGPNKP